MKQVCIRKSYLCVRRRNMRKFLFLLSLLAVFSLVLAACGPATTQAPEPGAPAEPGEAPSAEGAKVLRTSFLSGDVPWVRWNGEEVETVKICDGSADRIVNANDFAYGIYRNLLPANASPYG